MDTDLILVLGLVIAALSIPAMVSAFSGNRAPRAPALIILIAGAMIVFAVLRHPGGYDLAELPHVFFSVVRRYLP